MSREIRKILTERASNFNIALDDVSITSLTFGKEFTAAIEAKQVAAQEAERAKFVVEKAEQDKRSAIIRAEVSWNFGTRNDSKMMPWYLKNCCQGLYARILDVVVLFPFFYYLILPCYFWNLSFTRVSEQNPLKTFRIKFWKINPDKLSK